VVPNSGRVSAAVLVYFGEFIAVSEVDEGFAVADQVQVDPAVLIVIFGSW